MKQVWQRARRLPINRWGWRVLIAARAARSQLSSGWRRAGRVGRYAVGVIVLGLILGWLSTKVGCATPPPPALPECSLANDSRDDQQACPLTIPSNRQGLAGCLSAGLPPFGLFSRTDGLISAGELSSNDTRDFYRFQAAQPNARVRLTLADPVLDADYDLALLDQYGELVGLSAQEGPLPEYVERVLERPGQYFVLVQARPGKVAGDTVAAAASGSTRYTLLLSLTQYSPLIAWAQGPLPPGLNWAQGLVTTLGGLAIIITVVGLGPSYFRWRHQPRIMVGSPPTGREQRERPRLYQTFPVLNRRDRVTWTHNPAVMAVSGSQLRLPLEFSETDLFQAFAPRQVRWVYPDATHNAVLPVVVENQGHRRVPTYYVAVVFHSPGVHVLDVKTESLQIQTLFVNQPQLVEPPLAGRAVSQEITQAYEDYQPGYITQTNEGDIIYLDGSLDGEMYEMIRLKVRIDPQIERFAIEFSVGWTDTFIQPTRKERSYQGFRIVRTSAPAAP